MRGAGVMANISRAVKALPSSTSKVDQSPLIDGRIAQFLDLGSLGGGPQKRER